MNVVGSLPVAYAFAYSWATLKDCFVQQEGPPGLPWRAKNDHTGCKSGMLGRLRRVPQGKNQEPSRLYHTKHPGPDELTRYPLPRVRQLLQPDSDLGRGRVLRVDGRQYLDYALERKSRCLVHECPDLDRWLPLNWQVSHMTDETAWRPTADFSKSLKVFDFFCGCGGSSLGLQASGMKIAFGLDNDPDAERTFRANFPEAAFMSADIGDVPTSALDDVVEASACHPLLFSACAPCQPFSRQRTCEALPDDGRLGLLDHVSRFLRRFRPELIFVENVPGLRDGSLGRKVFERLTKALEELGYFTSHRIVRSQDYGVPQRRARLVLLASLFGPVEFPAPTHGHGSQHSDYATVGEWIGDLPAIAAGETHPVVPNHRAARLSPVNLRRIQATPQGGGWRNLPPDLMPESRKSGFNGFTDVYGRLSWDAPAPALTTRCISYSNGRFGHPLQNRAISVREAACLQTFPLDFVLTGNLNSQARQVGNAVPALLSQRFGECIASHLAGIATDIRSTSAGVGR